MRIADVAEFYAEAGGGVKTYIDAKLRAGAEAGHDIFVLAPGAENRTEPRLGGTVVWVKSPATPDPRYRFYISARSLHRALDEIQPDLVEASSPWGGAWLASRWRGSAARSFVLHLDPVAALAHPFFDRWISADRIDSAAFLAWSYLRRLAGRFDTTVVAGRWLAQRLEGFRIPRVEAVPFGIDATPFWQATARPELRLRWLASLGLPPDGRVLVAVSRHHPEKRLPTLIEAIRGLDLPVGLIIYGDGPARAQVERAARGDPRVWLAGYTRNREELGEALASADGFLHGSSSETFGLVVSEALAAGLPLIVPNAGGAAELAHPSYAETYSAGNVQACREAIQRWWARDPASLREAAERSRRSVRTLPSHFEGLFSHYTRLIQER